MPLVWPASIPLTKTSSWPTELLETSSDNGCPAARLPNCASCPGWSFSRYHPYPEYVSMPCSESAELKLTVGQLESSNAGSAHRRSSPLWKRHCPSRIVIPRTPAVAALTEPLAGEGEGCATSRSAQKQTIPNQHKTARGKARLAAG